ncbi:ABC transporter substrate-binding protein [Actinocatenispora rupis]|uniref:ABC transporter substrate-binding protein n=1 Tax=Actinocatenispora rupis TaxID=519421 RepID=A0A8J3JIJ4_9ACTN|nr:ABC transporter substrate-binding protein [Actinocatenispora rupis]GID15618.1 ABC transporter substrate-binding protein [Actinocatenispora rupis]
MTHDPARPGVRRRRVAPALAVLAAAAVALAGCGSSGGRSGASATPTAGGKYPVTAGSTTVDARPKTIVSLSPTTTEMLYAIGAGDQVKAVDDQSNYPADAPRTKLSGFKPNVEAIAGYDPDLVVLSYDTNNVVAGLKKLKIPVYVANAATTLDDSYREITDLGALTGHADGATKTVSGMKTGIAKAEKGLPRRKLSYYYELDPELHTATSKTFVGALFAPLGLTNVADKADKGGTGYPQLSKEYLLKSDPDLVFLADTKCCAANAASLAKRPGWSTLGAIKDKHVYPLNDDVASRWGPRVVSLVQAAANAVKAVPAT